MEPFPLPTDPEGFKAVTEEILRTDSDERAVDDCLAALRGLLPGFLVRPFGSGASGFGSRGADLDVAVSSDTLPVELNRVADVIKSRSEQGVRVKCSLFSARVPVLKCTYGDLEVDVTANNDDGVTNTRLLAAYADLDPELRTAVRYVKLWAKARDVSGSDRGRLSSYAITLMALYALQVTEVDLPVLDTLKFLPGEPGDTRVFKADGLDAAGLAQRVLKFYATEFQWEKEVVSIRRGLREMKESYPVLPRKGVTIIHIEDPFLLRVNLNRAIKGQNDKRLRIAFLEALGITPDELNPDADDADDDADEGADEDDRYDPEGVELDAGGDFDAAGP